MYSFKNMEKHLGNNERIKTLKKIEKNLTESIFPPQVVIENTSFCNLKCVHCSHKEMIRKPKIMKRELYNKIVEEIGREHPYCEVWPTFYGEALTMGDELWDRLDYAHAVGCKNLVLNSNGTFLSKNNNIEKVLKSPLKRFILSLDGFKKETFEKIRFRAKWDNVYPAVEELCKKRLESGAKYPTITAQFSVMKENVKEVDAYSEYWKSRGAEVKVRPMLEWTATGSVRSETIVHDNNLRIACPWANNTMAIHADGKVVACAVDYEGRFNGGDSNAKSLKEIWADMRNSLREHHVKHEWDQLPDICKGCGDWQVAGAEYEEEHVDGTRPFWYYEENQK